MLLVVLLACPVDPSASKEDASDSASDTASDRPASQLFPDGSPWYEDVSRAATDANSDMLIAGLQSRGWGLGRFQIDTSFEILEADASTPMRSFERGPDTYEPDCDVVEMPVPEDGNLEGEGGYACESDGDCHLLVRADHERKLYEMWRADIRGERFMGGCLAVWSMDTLYPPEGRGEQCTSADAAGYPIMPLLFTAEEVAAGEVAHAIRFALPNESIRDGEYYHPASHATNSGGGGADALPYGARLRLRADFDTSRIADPDAQVLVRTLQRYGMFLADGGNVALMAESDARATVKWADLFEDGTHALVGIEPQDFEVLALDGPAVPLTFECERNGL